MIVVTSMAADVLPPGVLRDYLEHASRNCEAIDEHAPGDHPLHHDVVAKLRQRGISCWPEYEAAGVVVDVVLTNDGKSTAVLCDSSFVNDVADPLQAHRLLARAQWHIFRISHRAWVEDWYACLERMVSPPPPPIRMEQRKKGN